MWSRWFHSARSRPVRARLPARVFGPELLEPRRTMAAALPASLPSLPQNTPTVQLDDYGVGRGTADISHGEFDRDRIVAPVTADYTIRVDPVSGSRLNPVVGVYDAAGRKLTGNEDVPEGVASEVRVALRQGKTYSFAVGTIERTMGSYAWVVDGPRTEDEYETGSANPFAAYKKE